MAITPFDDPSTPFDGSAPFDGGESSGNAPRSDGIAVLSWAAPSPFTQRLTVGQARAHATSRSAVLARDAHATEARSAGAHRVTVTARVYGGARTVTRETLPVVDQHSAQKIDTLASALWQRDRAREETDLLAALL